MMKNEFLSFDIETRVPYKGLIHSNEEVSAIESTHASLIGFSIASSTEESNYYPIYNINQEKEYLKYLKPILENNKIICHNAKYEYSVLLNRSIELLGEPIKINIGFDTMIAHYLIEPELNHSLKDIARRRYSVKWGFDFSKLGSDTKITIELQEELASYCNQDAKYAYKLYLDFKKYFEEDNYLYNYFYQVELPCIPIICEMEMYGMKINTNYLEDIKRSCQYEQRILQKEIEEIISF